MGESKIDELHITRVVKNDIFKFQIAMSDSIRVAVSKSIQKLFKVISANVLGKVGTLLEYFEEVYFSHFHDNSIDLLVFL